MTSENKDKIYFGIDNCHKVYEKIRAESSKLEIKFDDYDFFNFIITAWHLYDDWLKNDREHRPIWSIRKKNKTPKQMMEVINIARDIANGSKHMVLNNESLKRKVVVDVHQDEICDWYSYLIVGPQHGISTKSWLFLTLNG